MKRIIKLLLIAILTLCFWTVTKAQYGVVRLSNGITVVVKTQITPSESKKSLGNIYSSNSGNVIHRILTDRENKIYFGYDLSLEKAEDGKFRVSIKPLSKTPDALMNNSRYFSNQSMGRAKSAASQVSRVSVGRGRSGQGVRFNNPDYSGFTEESLPNYPEDFVVSDGDTISLDILENPKTNTKITDVITISSKSQNFQYFSGDDKPIRDFSINDVYLRLENPDVYVNDKKYETRSTVAGNINWIYIDGKGRFIFSFKPHAGYNFQKIGTIKNNELTFNYNGDKYKFISRSPILGQGGNWNLWIMHDPEYQPAYEMSEQSPFVFGAAGKVDYLFERR